MGKTTFQVTLDDEDLAGLGQAVVNLDAGHPIYSDSPSHRMLARAVERISESVKDGTSEGFCFRCRHSKDLEGMAAFPNGMDSIFAHEIVDAIGFIRTLLAEPELDKLAALLRRIAGHDGPAKDYFEALHAGGRMLEGWKLSDDARAKAQRTIKKLDDRVRIYNGIIEEYRREEAANEPPDGYEPDDDGFEVVD